MGDVMSNYRKFPIILAIAALVAACAPAFKSPADPANAWLNGAWTAETGRWRQDLALQVGDGNKVQGTFSNTSPAGNTSTGSVAGEVNGNQVKLKVSMNSGTEYKIDLERNGGLLSGIRASSSDSWQHVFNRK